MIMIVNVYQWTQGANCVRTKAFDKLHPTGKLRIIFN